MCLSNQFFIPKVPLFSKLNTKTKKLENPYEGCTQHKCSCRRKNPTLEIEWRRIKL